MGQSITSKCRDCGWEFLLSVGGGFCFERLQCDSCSETLDIDRGEYDLTKQYECSCGGLFSQDAPPRCPKCQSTKIDKGKSDSGDIQHICYD